MALDNKLSITNSADLVREEEKISKKKAVELFEKGLLAMERSPIKDIEIKYL